MLKKIIIDRYVHVMEAYTFLLIKDSCEGSGLSTIESSQDSHPLFLCILFYQSHVITSHINVHMFSKLFSGVMFLFRITVRVLYRMNCCTRHDFYPKRKQITAADKVLTFTLRGNKSQLLTN